MASARLARAQQEAVRELPVDRRLRTSVRRPSKYSSSSRRTPSRRAGASSTRGEMRSASSVEHVVLRARSRRRCARGPAAWRRPACGRTGRPRSCRRRPAVPPRRPCGPARCVHVHRVPLPSHAGQAGAHVLARGRLASSRSRRRSRRSRGRPRTAASPRPAASRAAAAPPATAPGRAARPTRPPRSGTVSTGIGRRRVARWASITLRAAIRSSHPRRLRSSRRPG